MKNLRLAILVAMLLSLGLASPPTAQAVSFHGISFLKGADTPVEVNSPYLAAYLISNTVDTAQDTLRVNSLTDVVHAFDGNVPSGNILTSLTWNLHNGAHWDGSVLVLPFGSSADSNLFSFYTVEVNDFSLPGHILPDDATIIWTDDCTSGSGNCPIGNQTSTTGSQALVTAPLPCVTVDKTVQCNYSMPGEMVTYSFDIHNCGTSHLTKVSIIDTLLGNLTGTVGCGTIAAGADCTFDVNYVIPDPYVPTTLKNTVTVVYENEFSDQADANDSVTINVVHPDFTVTKSCQNEPVPPGGSAIFDIVITNTGDVALDFTTNEPCLPGPFPLAKDANVAVTVSRPFDGNDVFNQVIVEANLPNALCFQLHANIVKEANDTCHGQGGATRTPGFWKTHCEYTEHVLNVHCGGSINLGWVNLTNINDVLGVLYANKAKNTDGSKRSDLCQARIITSFQAVAALLNNCLDNGAPLPVTPSEIAAILGGTDITAIRNLGSLLDGYNNSGDDVAIIDGDGFVFGHATPRDCRAIANLTKVDCINVVITSGRRR